MTPITLTLTLTLTERREPWWPKAKEAIGRAAAGGGAPELRTECVGREGSGREYRTDDDAPASRERAERAPRRAGRGRAGSPGGGPEGGAAAPGAELR